MAMRAGDAETTPAGKMTLLPRQKDHHPIDGRFHFIAYHAGRRQ